MGSGEKATCEGKVNSLGKRRLSTNTQLNSDLPEAVATPHPPCSPGGATDVSGTPGPSAWCARATGPWAAHDHVHVFSTLLVKN